MSGLAGVRHEARFYSGPNGFLAATVPFIRNGLEEGASVLVIVPEAKIGWLRDALDGDAPAVRFADMAGVGHNPAWILPAWRRFVDEEGANGGFLRGIGEPIGPDRSQAALAECHRHERLINVAFDDERPWRLLCPYDTEALDPQVVAEARRTHPYVDDGPSADFDAAVGAAPFAAPLPDPPGRPVELAFDHGTIRSVRRVVSSAARTAGVLPHRAADLALAAHELGTNSVRYGGGYGKLRSWTDRDSFVVEVRDAGFIDDALVGREAPPPEQRGGRGVWLCNQLCDLVQIHSSPATGTAIRLHMRVGQRST